MSSGSTYTNQEKFPFPYSQGQSHCAQCQPLFLSCYWILPRHPATVSYLRETWLSIKLSFCVCMLCCKLTCAIHPVCASLDMTLSMPFDLLYQEDSFLQILTALFSPSVYVLGNLEQRENSSQRSDAYTHRSSQSMLLDLTQGSLGMLWVSSCWLGEGLYWLLVDRKGFLVQLRVVRRMAHHLGVRICAYIP